jgi:hypothetical protein
LRPRGNGKLIGYFPACTFTSGACRRCSDCSRSWGSLIHDTGEEDEIETEPVFPGEPLAAFVPHGHRFTAGHGARVGGERPQRHPDVLAAAREVARVLRSAARH